MEIRMVEGKNGAAAVVSPPENGPPPVACAQDALDLLATAHHLHGCDRLVLPKACLSEDFFDLRTGLAGEILQKFTNYRMKVAIVGNFDGYQSRALRDFIRECNRGSGVFFVPDEATALEKLAQAK